MIIFSKLLTFLRFATSSVFGQVYDEGEIDTALKRELSENGYTGKYIM